MPDTQDMQAERRTIWQSLQPYLEKESPSGTH